MQVIKFALVASAFVSTQVLASALSYREASEITTSIVALASEKGYNVSATVLDADSHSLANTRSNQAGPYTARASYKKAYTSLIVQAPTIAFLRQAFEKQPVDLEKFIVANITNSDHIIFLPGGVPIRKEGEIIGAVGVGGAPGGHLDDALAKQVLTDLGFTY